MADPQFKVGDTVRLASGGPVMTVVRTANTEGEVFCRWFVGDQMDEGEWVPEAALRTATPES